MLSSYATERSEEANYTTDPDLSGGVDYSEAEGQAKNVRPEVELIMQRPRMRRKKRHPGPCFFCQSGREVVWKDTLHLRRFLTARGKIRMREETGLCAKHQHQVAQAVKHARVAALLPFTEK